MTQSGATRRLLATEPGQQCRKLWPVLLTQGFEFQAEPCSRGGMAHNGFDTDRSFLHKKIKARHRAGRSRPRSLDKQAAQAHVAHLRNILAALALPTHPHVSRTVHT
jgi:hypothetical protein